MCPPASINRGKGHIKSSSSKEGVLHFQDGFFSITTNPVTMNVSILQWCRMGTQTSSAYKDIIHGEQDITWSKSNKRSRRSDIYLRDLVFITDELDVQPGVMDRGKWHGEIGIRL